MPPLKYSNEFLDKILALREAGVSWSAIDERFDCNTESLKVTLSKYRHGKRTDAREKYKKMDSEILRRLKLGQRDVDMAISMQVSRATIHNHLAKIGIDGELRKEMRDRSKNRRVVLWHEIRTR